MKRIFIFLVLIPFFGKAQTLQGSAFPAIGSTYTFTLADTSGVQPGNSGQGITWDFSGLVNAGTTQVDSFLMPSRTPYGSVFPTADIADHEINPSTNYYVYYHNSGTAYQRIGNVQPDTVIYSDPANEFPYPVSYGDSFSDTYYSSYHQSTGGALVHMSGVVNENADGTGTLILPTGTYSNILRVSGVRNEHDTVFGTPNFYIVNTVTYYDWYQTNVYWPLLQIETTHATMNFGGPINSKQVGYRAGIEAGINNLSKSGEQILVYPNPSPTGNFQIILRDKSDKVSQVEVVDVTGRIIYQESKSSVNAIHLDSQMNGLYFYKIQTEKGGVFTGKLLTN